MFQPSREGVGVCMLYGVQSKNVFSLRLKVWVGMIQSQFCNASFDDELRTF